MNVKTGRKAALFICLTAMIMSVCLLSGCTTFDSFRHAYFEEKDEDQMPVITIGVKIKVETGYRFGSEVGPQDKGDIIIGVNLVKGDLVFPDHFSAVHFVPHRSPGKKQSFLRE